MACLGFTAAMLIACIVPLFTTVATSASLQSILQANQVGHDITLDVATEGLNSATVQKVQQLLPTLVQPKLAPYEAGPATMSIETDYFYGVEPASLQHVGSFNLYAPDLANTRPALHLLQGHWPVADQNALQILLTPVAAQALHLSLGEQITLQGGFTIEDEQGGPIDTDTALTMQLVGLFALPDPAPADLHGQTFLPFPTGASTTYSLLTDSTLYLQALDRLAASLHSDAIYASLNFHLTWDYPLHTSGVQPSQVNDLTNRLFTAENEVGNFQATQQQATIDTPPFPYITRASLYSPTPGTFALLDLLEAYTNRVTLVGIPITILAIQIIALLLFFVSLLIGMLLERQMNANAVLSSRGASARQIFWSLFIQGLALCIAGIVVGPLLSVLIVTTLVLRVLPGDSVQIAHSVLSEPLSVIASIGPTAGGTLLAALLTIGLIVRYTSGLNMLTLRRETARVSRPPFWQRYYLDALAAVVAFSAYGVSLYLASVAHEVDLTTQDLILAPLTLVAPIFLLLGCLLLFLRVFPWLLRLGSWIANRQRGATTMLALVQMARSPRQIIRMTMLLSLTVAFALFAQVFSASQTQHISDISAYETGADFSGDLGQTSLNMSQILAHYRALPGVLSASADYTDQGESVNSTGASTEIDFRAIDSLSFGRTAIWNTQDSAQSLASLLATLPRSRWGTIPNGSSGWIINAVIDQALAAQLQLNVGGVFTMSLNSLSNATLSYQVEAIVAHIPTINSSTEASSSTSPGGMLVDYQTFARVYAQTVQQQQVLQHTPIGTPLSPGSSVTVPVNHIWLRTSDNTMQLTALRAALNAATPAVSNLYDRREIAAELEDDPFNLNILVILGIGALTAFLLAFLGNLISSWLSVRNRQASFVVLRALGANARQIAGLLLWEQGIVYAGAILLGLAFGIVLIKVAVPVLVFTGLPRNGPMSTLSISDLYLLQHVLPTQIIIPASLDLIFPALVVVCLVALFAMIRAALQPSISHELRLNED
jgi:ABC-type antimicrobial peptide transport system permease subunit